MFSKIVACCFCILLFLQFGLQCNSLTAQESAPKIRMFDGKTLKGWDGDPKFWSVEDGAITGKTTEENKTKGNTFCIWTGGDADNFELNFD